MFYGDGTLSQEEATRLEESLGASVGWDPQAYTKLAEASDAYETSLDKLQKEVRAIAIEKGWEEVPRSLYEMIALMHSELSEALESARNGHSAVYLEGEKPEGWAVELADCVIRIMHTLAMCKFSLEALIRVKHEYNKGRSYRHGGKKV